MNQLIIAAFPEAALNIIVADQEDNEIARSLAFEPDMIPTMVELLENFGPFDTATLYGPLPYIEGIEKKGLGLAIMNRLLNTCNGNYIKV